MFVYHDPEHQDRSWLKARMNCMVLGADLVSINTDLEAYYLSIILKVQVQNLLTEQDVLFKMLSGIIEFFRIEFYRI